MINLSRVCVYAMQARIDPWWYASLIVKLWYPKNRMPSKRIDIRNFISNRSICPFGTVKNTYVWLVCVSCHYEAPIHTLFQHFMARHWTSGFFLPNSDTCLKLFAKRKDVVLRCSQTVKRRFSFARSNWNSVSALLPKHPPNCPMIRIFRCPISQRLLLSLKLHFSKL